MRRNRKTQNRKFSDRIDGILAGVLVSGILAGVLVSRIDGILA